MAMWREVRLKACLTAVAALCLVSVAACGADNPDTGEVVKPHAGHDGLPESNNNGGSKKRPTGYFSFQPLFSPLTLSIGTDGSIGVGLDASVMTPLGRIGFNGDVAQYTADHRKVPDEAFDATQLIVCQDNDRKNCAGYQIHTGRKLTVELDGHFKETVEAKRITIIASPGSTVTVTDVGGPPTSGARAAALIDIEEFDFSELSKNTDVDLEKSLVGFAADISYDHVTGQLRPINGARVSRIRQYAGDQHGWLGTGMPEMDIPGENDCATMPPEAWHTEFTPKDLTSDIVLACIGTSEDDFGYIVIGRDRSKKPASYYLYSYTWVR